MYEGDYVTLISFYGDGMEQNNKWSGVGRWKTPCECVVSDSTSHMSKETKKQDQTAIIPELFFS